MTTVLLVSGSWPPQPCGVGDYTEVLGRELEKHGVSVARFRSNRFSRFYSSEIVDEIRETDCDLIHIQYPTAGYGRSFTPSALARAVRDKPVVVTLHEYSLFRWYRRPWFSQFARHCAARIFTTDDECNLFQRRFPVRNGLDSTIEIGSNIPASPPKDRRTDKICYFGLIAPGKGIEDFLELCALASAAAINLPFELIGAIPERHTRYANEILKRAAAFNVRILLSLPEHAVADRLGSSTYAYLPFPDGASAKRGTLAAAIVNGLIVITRHSSITPQWIRAATLDAKTPSDAMDALLRLQSDRRCHSELRDRAGLAASHFRWDAIAQRHANLYRHLLGVQTAGRRSGASATAGNDTAYESRLVS